jgi:hypothetical protein
MPLTNFDEVTAYATMISFVTESGYMPPWIADSDYSHFRDENVLTKKEITIIKDWIKHGLKKGDHLSILKEEQDKINSIVNPDLIFSMAESFEQYGIYYDQHQVFVIPVELDEDAWVKEIEFVPGNKDIVRSCTISLDLSEKSDSLDQWDPRYGYYHFGGIGFLPEEYVWYHWSPNKTVTILDENYYKCIPKGSKLLFHIYYGPTGNVQKDSSVLKLKLWNSPFTAKKKITSIPLVTEKNLTNPPFVLEPDEHKRYHAKIKLDKDIELHAIMPHSQLLCTSWEVFAMPPDTRKPIKLLKISNWDFHWKREYEFPKPILLPENTIIHTIASFNNSQSNFFNPSTPPTTIRSGFGMFEELFLIHFSIVELE